MRRVILRHIDTGLDEALHAVLGDLVEHDRHDDGNREAPQQVVHIQQQRVGQQSAEVVGVEESLEVLQPHPLAACNAEDGLVIPEGNLNAVHGHVVEHKEIDDCRQDHQVQLVFIAKPGVCTQSARQPAGAILTHVLSSNLSRVH